MAPPHAAPVLVHGHPRYVHDLHDVDTSQRRRDGYREPGPHFTQWAFQVVGSTCTASFRPQAAQNRGGSLTSWRAQHLE